MIHIDKYDKNKKKIIIEKHILPKLDIKISPDVILKLIENIDEPGVRQIKKTLIDLSDKYKLILHYVNINE